MLRFLTFLLQAGLLIAVAIMAYGAVGSTAVPGAGGMADAIVATAGGLLLGLLYARLRGIAWDKLPERFRAWRSQAA